MQSSATIQTSAVTVAQKRSLETFYRAFNDKNSSLLEEAVTPNWQDIPLVCGQAFDLKSTKPLMTIFFTVMSND
jgi:hypothetical protein